jgi:hypothetical protein
MYARAMQTLKDVNVENINVSDLGGYDFEPSLNHIFIRSIDEDKQNIFLIYMFGNIPAPIVDNVKIFLQKEKRSKFHLSAPNVTINLGNVSPIVLSDRQNAKNLTDVCDVVEIADVTRSELPALVADIVESKKDEYCLKKVELSDDAVDCLSDMSMDDIERCLDRAVRIEALKSDSLLFDKDTLTKYKDATMIRGVMGFGFGRTDD